jgi:hypothetical protein
MKTPQYWLAHKQLWNNNYHSPTSSPVGMPLPIPVILEHSEHSLRNPPVLNTFFTLVTSTALLIWGHFPPEVEAALTEPTKMANSQLYTAKNQTAHNLSIAEATTVCNMVPCCRCNNQTYISSKLTFWTQSNMLGIHLCHHKQKLHIRPDCCLCIPPSQSDLQTVATIS